MDKLRWQRMMKSDNLQATVPRWLLLSEVAEHKVYPVTLLAARLQVHRENDLP